MALQASINRNNVIDNLIPYFNDPRYRLLILDMGFGKITQLQSKYPKQLVNCGIAEQSTVGIASGMAEVGLIPIVYSIAAFLVYRALEQIRNDIVLRNMNVKLIGNGSGDFFKLLGKCHCCGQEDIALMGMIGLQIYDSSEFDEWINSSEAGYFRC